MTISRRLAGLMGGVLTVASQPGLGAAFMLPLPEPGAVLADRSRSDSVPDLAVALPLVSAAASAERALASSLQMLEEMAGVRTAAQWRGSPRHPRR